MRKKIFYLLLLTYCAISRPAFAEEADRAEGVDFEAGESEIELQTIASHYDAGTELETQLQFEHGLSENWSVGAEIEFEREPGDGLRESSATVSFKWRAPVDKTSPLAFAVKVAVGADLEDDRFLVETSALGSLQAGDWLLGARLRMTTLPGSGDLAQFDYRARLERELTGNAVLGVQMAGDIRSDDPAEHRLGPIVSIDVAEEVELEFGVFAGLNRHSPDVELNAEISWEF